MLLSLFGSILVFAPAFALPVRAGPVVISGSQLYYISIALPSWQRIHNYGRAQLEHVTVYVEARDSAAEARGSDRIAFEDDNVSPSVTTVYDASKWGSIALTSADPSGWTRLPVPYLAPLSSVIEYIWANPSTVRAGALNGDDDGVKVLLSTSPDDSVYKIEIRAVELDAKPLKSGCGPDELYIVAKPDYSLRLDPPCL